MRVDPQVKVDAVTAAERRGKTLSDEINAFLARLGKQVRMERQNEQG